MVLVILLVCLSFKHEGYDYLRFNLECSDKKD
jgi:hypothetical protein